ncbi:NB-ARC domain-containing protein [Nocardiopsis sp. EMB25]|uniref:AfsR/SARP family transcriptional regulator n=1 Tax=Nocardiopsis sp. EMB25 TaxID=2835867 RepID=UPI002283A4A1|nr:BTAD domain-containing putative transcriptional regulator [Nocardiopsis sp. EMB25]MCY9785352.1 NB-ARC domain-containing protein [Nocardiopsis sp. EMB25]
MRFRLLGPVEVVQNGEPLHVGGPKRATVLAALLLQPNSVVGDDRLIDLLWDCDPPRSARGQLQVHVHKLRALLGPETIVRRPSGYEIAVDPASTDLGEFERLLARARSDRAAERHDAALAALRTAVSLWSDPPLGGVTAPLADSARPWLEERRLSALEEIHDLQIATGHHFEAIAGLRRTLSLHPAREAVAEQLMSALQSCGRIPEALEVYTELRERLVEELGIEPGPRLRRLHQRLLRGETASERDTAPTTPSTAPTAAAPPVRPAELPHDIPDFVGRTAELEELDAVLEGSRDANAIVFVTGIAGVGKSALAVRWSHTVRDRFPGGQLHVDLRGSGGQAVHPRDALRHLLHSLGADHRFLPVDVEGLTRLYRSMTADRRLLLLLDDTATTEQVTPLLPGGRGSVVLVTGRRDLTGLVARHGARRVHLDVLSQESSIQLLRAVIGTDALAARPEAEAEFGDRCGHLPLALRLAAANISTGAWEVAEALNALQGADRFSFLSGDDGSGSVAATFSGTYRSLHAEGARLLRLLGTVPLRSVTRRTAAAVAGLSPDRAAQLLRELSAHHLVERDPGDRYHLHGLVRAHAAELASDRERESVAHRLLTHYQDAVDRSDPHLWDEGGNITATVAHAREHGRPEEVVRLVRSLAAFVWDGGAHGEWLATARAGLDCARRCGDPDAEAAMRVLLGEAHLRFGPTSQAVESFTAALDSPRRTGADQTRTRALLGLARAGVHQGDLTGAAPLLEHAWRTAEEIGWRTGSASGLGHLGAVLGWMGRLEEGHQKLARAIELCRETGAETLLHRFLCEMSWNRRCMGDPNTAWRDAREALSVAERTGNPVSRAIALAGLAQVLCDVDDPDAARAHAGRAMRAAEVSGTPWAVTAALNARGRAELSAGRYADADALFTDSLQHQVRDGLHWHSIDALIGRAAACARLGRDERATWFAEQAAAVADRHGYALLRARAVEQLAELRDRAGRGAEAADLRGTARRIRTTSGQPPAAGSQAAVTP